VGASAIERLLLEKPERYAVWQLLSPDDQEIMTVWLGLPRWPIQRRDRRRRAAGALDLGAESAHRLLHQRLKLTMPVDASSMPPFNI
jgi:hypothetical protein